MHKLQSQDKNNNHIQVHVKIIKEQVTCLYILQLQYPSIPCVLLKGTFVILFTQILSLIWPWPVQYDGHDLICSIWGLWHLLTSSRRRPDLCRVLVSDAPPIQAPFINTRGTFKKKWKSLNFITCTNGYTSQFKEYF